MTIIHAQRVGKQALLSFQELEILIAAARRSEPIDVHLLEEDIPTWGWMKLLEESGSFDFWKDPGEDIYSVDDGEPV